MPETERQRPAEALSTDPTAIKSEPILAPSTLIHPKAVAPGWAVFVMRRDEKWRRQVYLSLHAATKAMERARVNGVEARCMLVELVPVPHAPLYVVGGEDA